MSRYPGPNALARRATIPAYLPEEPIANAARNPTTDTVYSAAVP